MPLPPSAIPAYQPRSFLGPNQTATTRALELYFRYHPAVFKAKTFELLQQDEAFQAAADAEKRKLISQELSQIDGLLARYRSTGAGPSGIGAGAGRRMAGGVGGAGGAGGADGDVLDFIEGMTGNEVKRAEIAAEAGWRALRDYDKLIEVPRPYAQFAAEFLGNLDRGGTIGRMAPAQLAQDMELAFLDAQQRFGASATSEDPLTRQVAATDLYYALRQRRPDLLPAVGEGKTLTREALEVISAIDRMYGTNNFIAKSFQSGREPQVALDAEKEIAAATLLGKTAPGPNFFEKRAREIVNALPADQRDTPEEIAAAERTALQQVRAELGIGEPLSDEEALMLSRYTQALADDGRATREELGDDYDAAKAAFEKGRRAERLPRGADVYYDDTYLNLLQRRAGLLSQQVPEREGTPTTRAARRMGGLPEVPREAYEAAAAVSPIAAEALPYAMKRFTDAGGQIAPQSTVETKADLIIKADPTKRPTFPDFVAAVNKMYPDDVDARREAFAYYGAYFNGRDLQTQTTDANVLQGKPPAPTPAPAPLPAPMAMPMALPPTPDAAGEAARQQQMALLVAAQRQLAEPPMPALRPTPSPPPDLSMGDLSFSGSVLPPTLTDEEQLMLERAR